MQTSQNIASPPPTQGGKMANIIDAKYHKRYPVKKAIPKMADTAIAIKMTRVKSFCLFIEMFTK
jgi:hypothetical protein